MEPTDVPELRPGDRVTVLVSFPPGVTDPADAAGRSEILLASAEVIRLLDDRDGLGGGTRVRAVQLRVPADRLEVVAQAVAAGRISMARLSPGDVTGPQESFRREQDSARREPDPARQEPDPVPREPAPESSRPKFELSQRQPELSRREPAP